MDAAIKAKALESARGARAKQICRPTEHKDCQQNKTRYHGSRATDPQGQDAQDIITVQCDTGK